METCAICKIREAINHCEYCGIPVCEGCSDTSEETGLICIACLNELLNGDDAD